MSTPETPDPIVGQEFASALGGAVVGEITQSGRWTCLVPGCGEQGSEPDQNAASLAFHRHRSAVHPPEEQP